MWLGRIYGILGSAIVLLYALVLLFGWEFDTLARESPQQASARHHSGGHRSGWIWSYRGGK
jgi:hypothetical protein